MKKAQNEPMEGVQWEDGTGEKRTQKQTQIRTQQKKMSEKKLK